MNRKYTPEQIAEFDQIADDLGISYEAVVNRYRSGDRGERLRRPVRSSIKILGKSLDQIRQLIMEDGGRIVSTDALRIRYKKLCDQGITKDIEIAKAMLDYYGKEASQ